MRASESRLRAMLEAALDAVVTMDAPRARDRLEPRGRGDLRLPRRRGDRPRHGRADRAAVACATPHRRGLARFLETEHARRARPPARADRHAQGRHRVPRRADDHADRAARARRRSPATCATSPSASSAEAELRASRARLVEVADAERRRIQRNLHDGAQQRLTVGAARPRAGSAIAAAEATSCSTSRSTSSRPGCRRSASSRAACIPPVLTERGLAAALEALALRAPVPVELEPCPTGGCPSRSRRRRTTSSPRRSRTCTSTRRARRGRRARPSTTRALVVEVADDGVGGADPEGTACGASRPRRGARRDAHRRGRPRVGTRLLARIPLGG